VKGERALRKISLLALSLITSIVILTGMNSALKLESTTSAQTQTLPIIYVDPPRIKDATMGVGSTFTVNINIANVENLFGWQVNMTFNKEVVNCTSKSQIVQGPFLTDWFGVGYTTFARSINYAAGYLLVACSKTPPYNPGDIGATGNGTLAYITFTVIAEERATLLRFGENTYLRAVIGDPPVVTPIEPITTEDGYFDNRTENTSPVASFHVVTLTPETGVPVSFDASESYDVEGWLDSYHWDYGDNESQIYIRNINLTAQTTHIYMRVGTYTVTLTVTDNDGFAATSQEMVKVSGRPIISIAPEQGIVGTTVAVIGACAIPNDMVNIYWSEYIWDEYTWRFNYTLIGTAATDPIGNFSTSFQVPQSTLGTHYVGVMYLTSMTYDEKPFFVLPNITLEPTSGPIGTKITVRGTGFPLPYSYYSPSAYLFFDNQDFTIVMSDGKGNMQATINVPFAAPGPHTVRALIMYYSSPTPPGYLMPEATFTVIDTTPLDLTADVGAIYFKGETAQFTIQTAFKGAMTNATSVKARLQKPDGSTETLPVVPIATGLYKVRYPITGKGSMTGTYTIVIEANYTTDTIAAIGTTIKTFLVKSTWEKEAPKAAAFSLASIGLISAMLVLWRKEKKHYF